MKIYAILVILAIVSGLGWFAFHQYQRAEEYENKYDAAMSANEINVANVDRIAKDLNACIVGKKASKEASDKAIAELQAGIAEREARLSAFKKARKHDYESNKEYREWADTVVPGSVVERLLLQRAREN